MVLKWIVAKILKDIAKFKLLKEFAFLAIIFYVTKLVMAIIDLLIKFISSQENENKEITIPPELLDQLMNSSKQHQDIFGKIRQVINVNLSRVSLVFLLINLLVCIAAFWYFRHRKRDS